MAFQAFLKSLFLEMLKGYLGAGYEGEIVYSYISLANGCHCHLQNQEQSGKHLVEEHGKLTEARKEVEREEMEEWWMRHSRDTRKKK